MSSATAGAAAILSMVALSVLARGVGFYAKVEPWLAIVVVGLASLYGAGAARPSLRARRGVLLAWLLMAVVACAVAFFGPRLHPQVPVRLAVACAFVAIVASVAESIALQRRLRPLGSPVDPRHVGAASLVLAILGPLALLPPFGIWVHSGRFVSEEPAAPPKGGRRRKR